MLAGGIGQRNDLRVCDLLFGLTQFTQTHILKKEKVRLREVKTRSKKVTRRRARLQGNVLSAEFALHVVDKLPIMFSW